MTWRRYRFSTHATDDYRPLVFNPHYPWWCSASADDAVTIVTYLPVDEPLAHYWDDAFDVTYTEEERITFSSRFPRPEYFVE